jgi:type I restriction enzyme, S subunit
MSPDASSVEPPDVDADPRDPRLPSGWVRASVQLLAGADGLVVDGDWVETKDQDPDGDIRLVQLADIGEGVFQDRSNRYLTGETAHRLGCTFLSKGDVLIARMAAPLGRACIFPALRQRAVTAVDVCIWRPGSGSAIDPRWLMHALNSPQARALILNEASGTTRQRISGTKLKQLRLPIPPAAEQQRIVARIDELFGEIDEGEAALSRARQGLDTWRRGLLKAAVTGELTRDWREANRHGETGSDLLARIRAGREAAAPGRSRSSRRDLSERLESSSLAALPDGWAWATLGDLSSLITSGSRGWKQYYSDSGSVFIRAQNLKTDRLELDDVAYVDLPTATEGIRTRVSRHDILITITGANVTRSAQVDRDLAQAYVNQHVGLVRLTDSSLSDFVFLVVICPSHGRRQLKAAAYGAGKPGLNLEDLASVMVSVPPLEEQHLITRRFRDAVSEAENALVLTESARNQATTIRQSVLKAAFEGRLVPQDPTDEPASVLLARLLDSDHQTSTRRRRARLNEDFSHPPLPGLLSQFVDPRVPRG